MTVLGWVGGTLLALVVVGHLLFRYVKRRIGRTLHELVAIGVTASRPPELHLIADEAIAWTDRSRAFGLGRQLATAGFASAGQFRVREMPELKLAAMVHDEGFVAVVYEHDEAGVWCDVTADTAGGEHYCLSNAATGEDQPHPPNHHHVYRRGDDADALLARLRKAVAGQSLVRIAASDFRAHFERSYREETEWLQTQGPFAVAAAETLPAPPDDPAANAACAPLFDAIARGDAAGVAQLAGGLASLEGRDARGWTPLMCAAQRGEWELVGPLLEAGADPNARALGRPGEAPFQRGFADAIEDVEDEDARKFYKGLGAVMSHLGADAGPGEYYTPMLCAIEGGSDALVRRLADAGASLAAAAALTPLQYAAELGDDTILSALLDRGAEPDALGRDERNALHAAAEGGYPDAVMALLHGGADPGAEDGCGQTAIEIAADEGHAEVVHTLAARMKGRVVKRAHKRLASVLSEIEESYALHWDYDDGPPPDFGERIQPTPTGARLRKAARIGSPALVRRLLASGISADSAEGGYERRPGMTPLAEAAQGGHLEIIRLLVEAGADPNLPADDSTPLMRALDATFMPGPERALETVRVLVSLGADPNLRDAEGQTPLMQVVGSGGANAPALARLLIELGADARAEDEDGTTALQRARERGDPELEAALGRS